MISYERLRLYELGLLHILKAQLEKRSLQREFSIQKLNFDSNDYLEINWQETEATEIPLTCNVSEDGTVKAL